MFRVGAREPRKILVLRLGGTGEVVVITPALKALRQNFPHAEITLMAKKTTFEAIKGTGLVDKLLAFEIVYSATWRTLWNHQTLWQFVQLAQKLLSTHYDLFLSFQHLYFWRSIWKPLVFGFLSRARTRIGFDSFGRGFFYTHRVRDDRFEPRHLLYRNAEFLKLLGIESEDFQPVLSMTKEDDTKVHVLFKKYDISDGQGLVAINPGASHPELRWRLDYFVQVGTRLVQQYPVHIALVGAAHERDLCEKVKVQVGKRCTNFAGQTTLGQLGALLKRCRLLIANSTGTLHIAYALKIPTICISRQGDYHIWNSYREANRFVAFENDEAPCAICLRTKCKHKMLPNANVESVYETARSFLSVAG